ncbi:NUDIX hydrolase [Treponema brennaborense]|uniref:NUDIX hydrolase n=1 Tax=Treponema brennaborense (strain DSM 12168 / CIP 105900 / DD5/3) TaxID=906968 RepID=F4LKK5_TREBD|nr:NUDIX domain-containing protein [Treponema brennaborense]AEE17561.1 NUDIX hydrolase [Treponema brennaborense DSM 12168]
MANENANFAVCPKCGAAGTVSYPDSRRWVCSACNFNLYNNVAAAVGVIICDCAGRVLFEVRAKNPGKGLLTIPGGFVDPNESAEQAVVRECREEIGLEPAAVRFLCSYPNTYEFDHVTYKTCDLFFTARLPETGGDTAESAESAESDGERALLGRLTAQQSEVTAFTFESVASERDIARLPLAFDSVRNALRTYAASCHSSSSRI